MSTCPNAGPEDCYVLTPVQQKVVALLSAGFTIAAAARSAGIHRNTVAHWRRHPSVQAALDQATQAKGDLWRGQADALILLKAAVAILERQGRSPDVVQSVHNTAHPTPPVTINNGTNPNRPVSDGSIPANACATAGLLKTLVTLSPSPCETVHPAHNTAQPDPPAAEMSGTNPIQPIDRDPKTLVTSSPPPCVSVQPMHNLAHAPETERTNPNSISAGSPNPGRKPGRNHPCPCGSGKKFKRCCLSTGVSQ